MNRIHFKFFSTLVFFIFVSCSSGLDGLFIDNKDASESGSKWNLEITTTVPSQNMTIGFGGTVNMDIDWGDGNIENTNLTSITHLYSSPGVYVLKISGETSTVSFNNADARACLTGILSPIRGIDSITSFNNSFQDCTLMIGAIPDGLFDNTPEVTSFSFTFRGCSGLTGSIPSGLFDNNPLVDTFMSTFDGCSGLTGTIPSGLFDNNTLVHTFYYTFGNCSGLTGSIPTGLFDNNGLVTDFVYTFYGCSGLTGIPSGLFDNNDLVTDFSGIFNNCTSIAGPVPQLWDNTTAKFPNLISYDDCFLNVNGASNSGDIPLEWR